MVSRLFHFWMSPISTFPRLFTKALASRYRYTGYFYSRSASNSSDTVISAPGLSFAIDSISGGSSLCPLHEIMPASINAGLWVYGHRVEQDDQAASCLDIEEVIPLGPVDPDLAAIGEEAFATKCSACHKLEERYVGPQLGSVLSHRRPEFVMNMILNANEMVQRHPEVQALLAQYYTPMPVQVTDQEEARAILEYLRSNQTEAESTTSGSTGGP